VCVYVCICICTCVCACWSHSPRPTLRCCRQKRRHTGQWSFYIYVKPQTHTPSSKPQTLRDARCHRSLPRLVMSTVIPAPPGSVTTDSSYFEMSLVTTSPDSCLFEIPLFTPDSSHFKMSTVSRAPDSSHFEMSTVTRPTRPTSRCHRDTSYFEMSPVTRPTRPTSRGLKTTETTINGKKPGLKL